MKLKVKYTFTACDDEGERTVINTEEFDIKSLIKFEEFFYPTTNLRIKSAEVVK